MWKKELTTLVTNNDRVYEKYRDVCRVELLNRLACLLYEGYFKTVVDKGIREDEVDRKVAQYVADLDWIVMHLAKDLKGYRSYGK